MRMFSGVRAAASPLILVALLCGFSTSTTNVPDVAVIVTSAPAYDALAALRGGERFPQGAHLLLVQGGKAEPLVAGFAASADASVSFDAKTVLFAGKKSAGDPWQIWELAADGSCAAPGDRRRCRRGAPPVSARAEIGLRAPGYPWLSIDRRGSRWKKRVTSDLRAGQRDSR